MSEEVIQFIGVNELNDTEQAVVNKLSTEYYQKIKRSLHNMTSLAVHVKAHSKEGSKKKYVLHIRAIAPTHIFEEKNAVDWDLARTMHQAFESIQHQIEHRLKISSKGLKAHQTENRRNK